GAGAGVQERPEFAAGGVELCRCCEDEARPQAIGNRQQQQHQKQKQQQHPPRRHGDTEKIGSSEHNSNTKAFTAEYAKSAKEMREIDSWFSITKLLTYPITKFLKHLLLLLPLLFL